VTAARSPSLRPLGIAAPPLVLVVSDLHLTEGRDAETGMYAARENFFAAGAFRRFLGHYIAQGDAGRGALLVLNGDTLDFVRLRRTPDGAADLAAWKRRLPVEMHPLADRPVSRKERHFGFGTEAYKAVWKLVAATRGHPELFGALAEWVGAGGRVVLVKGNHDVEMHWPLLLTVLREELADRGAGAAAAARVDVSADGFRLGNVIVEHGHRFEAMTCVVGDVLLKGGTRLNLPLGSFINRYIINPLERLDPFLDNMKPSTQALLAVLRRRPVKIVATYFSAWRFLLRAVMVRKRWAAIGGPVLTVVAGLFLPWLTAGAILASQVWPQIITWIPSWLRVPATVFGVSFPALLPYLIGVVRDLARQLGWWRTTNHLFKGARTVAREARREGATDERLYVVMGHTHEQEVRRLEDDGRDLYVNTGTWIPLWPLDRADLAGRIYYSYAAFTGDDGAYRHASLIWDDQAGAPRAAPLLDAAEED
jgi:UDP-2,3-diacylglucosamine pyrophosphatase LpxH